MFETCQYAPTAVLFPPYCVDFPCNTQSIAASNRLVWRKNPSPSGTFPIFKQGLGGAKRSRSPSAASPVAFCLLFRHGKRRSPPAGGESSQQETKPLYHRPLIRPSGPPSPRGEGFWGRGSFVRSFSKRSRKAGQRRGGEIPRTLYLLWLKPPQSGFNKEGSTHETNPMRKRRNLQT